MRLRRKKRGASTKPMGHVKMRARGAIRHLSCPPQPLHHLQPTLPCGQLAGRPGTQPPPPPSARLFSFLLFFTLAPAPAPDEDAAPARVPRRCCVPVGRRQGGVPAPPDRREKGPPRNMGKGETGRNKKNVSGDMRVAPNRRAFSSSHLSPPRTLAPLVLLTSHPATHMPRIRKATHAGSWYEADGA